MSKLDPKIQLLLSAIVLAAVLIAMYAAGDDSGAPSPASEGPGSISPSTKGAPSPP